MLRSPLKVLFVLHRVLGWKTYADNVARVAGGRRDIRAEVLLVEPTLPLRVLMRHHRTEGIRRLVSRVDPITAYRGVFGRAIRRRIEECRPSLVHFASHWVGASALGLPCPVPFTVALDSTFPGMRGAPGGASRWSARDCQREAALVRRAERLFPWSGWAAKPLADDYGIDRSRIQVIPPSTEILGAVRRPERGGPFRILFAGNDFLRKGGDRLHRWVRDRLPDDCELHIASIDSRAAVKGRNVVWHGGVPNLRLRTDLMPRMDVLCHPTRSDMSAYVVVEAAMAGLPCVVSAVGGIPDLVEHGRTGLLVEPNDDDGFIEALRGLASSRGRLERMSRAAREHAERSFDAEVNYGAMIDQLVALAEARV